MYSKILLMALQSESDMRIIHLIYNKKERRFIRVINQN